MKLFIPIVLVLCIYLSGTDSAGLHGKSAIFSTKTDTSFVSFDASDFSSLTAFTVCISAASETTRNYALFSYATSFHNNEILLWQQNTTDFWVEMQNLQTKFFIPEMNALLKHICVTWESQGGEMTVWVNGRRSIRKVTGKGWAVKQAGMFIIGQDQDNVGGGFDKGQSFVGEITNVNMWDRVLKPNEIALISQGCYSDGGNIIDWGSTGFTAKGDVIIQDNNDCSI
ncbi:C-reactive protein-like [Leucoraja erinacea]|uniref:C-reactive protein-like n=1 Tax=Leucoraja erinaceus TaxID=7782 RepID=UPI002454117B|nr:C-reactive protein-like [Leucoraja erinacea]